MAVKLNNKKKAAPAAAKKTTQKSKPAPAPAKKATGGLTIAPLDPKAVAAAFESTAQQGSGPKTPYMKFKVGKNRIRILPIQVPLMSGPYLQIRANSVRGAKDKYGRTMLSYEWIVRDEAILQKLLASGRIKQTDVQLFQAHGDPAIEIAAQAKKQDLETKRSLWPSNKYLFVVVNRADSGVYVFEAGQKFVDFLRPLVVGTDEEPAEYPELFNLEDGFDIIVEATGEGLQRRYTYSVARQASEVEAPAELPDLWATVTRYAVPYAQKVAAVFEQEPEVTKALGLKPESFGVSGSVAASDDDDDDDMGLGD